MTEKYIQRRLYLEFIDKRKHKCCSPNVYIFDWECDLVTINRNNYIYEFEIKSNKWDYINDFKKTEKHKSFKRLVSKSGLPNYFYYVCPKDLIKLEDIPEYAGLIYIDKEYNRVNEIKKAPILHKNEFDKWESIAIKLSYKLNL